MPAPRRYASNPYTSAWMATVLTRLPSAMLMSYRCRPQSGPSDSCTYSSGSTGVPTGLTCSQLAPFSLWHCAVYSPGEATHGVEPVGVGVYAPSTPGKGVVDAYGSSGPAAPVWLSSVGFTHATSEPGGGELLSSGLSGRPKKEPSGGSLRNVE